MGIFTSQNKSLQELPKPSSIDIGVIRGSDLGEIESHNSFSISEPNVKKKIFVKMDHYREAIDIVEKIKEKDREIAIPDVAQRILLEHFAPSAVIINEKGDIVHKYRGKAEVEFLRKKGYLKNIEEEF